MPRNSLFSGLIFDEHENPVKNTHIGDDPCYIVDDHGFQRHIPSELVDRQVFNSMVSIIEEHEDIISDQTARMLGQDDPFSKAMILTQLKQMKDQFDNLLLTGIPEEVRSYMGMMGFRITINVHGEVIDINQPGMISPETDY